MDAYILYIYSTCLSSYLSVSIEPSSTNMRTLKQRPILFDPTLDLMIGSIQLCVVRIEMGSVSGEHIQLHANFILVYSIF